jgi:hypothetical protein
VCFFGAVVSFLINGLAFTVFFTASVFPPSYEFSNSFFGGSSFYELEECLSEDDFKLDG